MAEAYPEIAAKNRRVDDQSADEVTSPLSILVLATKWLFDTLGISTINRSLVNNLRLVDPEAKKIKITCAVVEEEGKIKEDHLKDAEEHGVQLRGATQPNGPKEQPNIKWLNRYVGSYYHQLFKKHNYDFLIGHVPHLANGCFNFKSICQTEKSPKILLVIHQLPETPKGVVDGEQLLDWLKGADVVLSLGSVLHSEIEPYITSLKPGEKPVHKMYIPMFPLELFNLQREIPRGNKPHVTQNISLMTGEVKDLDVSGLDLALAVACVLTASTNISQVCGVQTNLFILTARKEDNEKWKTNIDQLLHGTVVKQKNIKFQCLAPEDIKQLETHMRKINLFIFPAKTDSPVFGTETLAAVAAGVPILVSKQSGIASVLSKMAKGESSLVESGSDSEIWSKHIIGKIMNPEEAQRRASSLREQLLLDVIIASTHLDFINIVAGRLPILYQRIIQFYKL